MLTLIRPPEVDLSLRNLPGFARFALLELELQSFASHEFCYGVYGNPCVGVPAVPQHNSENLLPFAGLLVDTSQNVAPETDQLSVL